MKSNSLKPFALRTALVWCLLTLWLAGSVQASIHGMVFTSQVMQPASVAIHSYAEVSDALHPHSQSQSGHSAQGIIGQTDLHFDIHCVEQCLLMSLAPEAQSLAHAGPGVPFLVELRGFPAGLTQPAVPPPRSLLL